MKKIVSREQIERIGFLRVNPDLLEEGKRQAFHSKKVAIQLLLNGHTYVEVEKETGIKPSALSKLYSRYTTLNDEGLYCGELAFLSGTHLKPYQRKTAPLKKRSEQQGGYSGVLGLTLRNHLGLEVEFQNLVLGKTENFVEGKKTSKSLMCADFYALLKAYGVTDDEWPFNEASRGRRTILGYINKILESDLARSARVLGGSDAYLHSKVGTGDERLIQAAHPFDVVQIDSYKIDGYAALRIYPEQSITVTDIVSRFWMIAAVDTRTTSVLARKTCYSSEVRAEDIADVIIRAFLGSWKPKEKLEKSGLEYLPGSGMPGYLLPESKCMVWGSVSLDNAMQHHAGRVHDLVLDRICFALNFGQLKRPERRTEVENLFKQVASKFIHQIPSTTGSNPYSGRADTPEENAVKYEIEVDALEEALDVYIAAYNTTPRSGWCYSKSPIEIMGDYLRDGRLVWPKITDNYVAVSQLSSIWKLCMVRGNIKKGTRPYIETDGATYTSNKLSSASSRISTRLWIKINPEDYRELEAYTEDGVFFDTLLVSSGWARTAHSVTTRKIINRAKRKKEFSVHQGDDIVSAWNRNLQENRSKKNNLELARMREENGGGPKEDCESDPKEEDISSQWSDIVALNLINLKPGEGVD
ncbi:hypothetical protein ACFPU0_11740 [Pseudomonas sp. GCM10022186]|uniref:hypothetical protein n=1 Tax=Pseudomonas sp. GCM10022186 TaxID=3252650 RepID=UPI0036085299